MNQSQSWQETWHCPCASNQSEKDNTRGRTLTLERRVFATAATAEQIAVDGGETSGGRSLAARGRFEDPKRQSRLRAGEGFRKFFQNLTRQYI